MRRLGRSMTLPALVLSVAVAACSGDGRVDGPVLVSPRPGLFGGSGMDGIVTGTVIFDQERGCVLLQQPDDERILYPIVWPAGAAWQADPLGVVLNDGRLIQPGMSVRGSGGYVASAQVVEAAGGEVAEAASRCAGATGEIAMFNADSEVTRD